MIATTRAALRSFGRFFAPAVSTFVAIVIVGACAPPPTVGPAPGAPEVLNPEVSVGVHLALDSEWKGYRWGPVSGAFGEESNDLWAVPVDQKASRLSEIVGRLDPDRARLITYRELIAREGLETMRDPSPAQSQHPAPVHIYVGTASGDPDNGIHVLRFDPGDGSLVPAPLPVTSLPNPSFLALSPDGRTLYAVREVDEGGVAAYRRDPDSGRLTALGRSPSGGSGPAYVSVHPSGQWLLVANYGGGSVALLPIDDDGRPGDPVDVVQHRGSGPDPTRQEAPHPHYIRTSPDGRRALVADLGIDRVIAYPLDGRDGDLGEDRAVVTRTAPGGGPRHMAFHPDGSVVYLVNELHGSVTAWSYDAERGTLDELQTVSTLPHGFDGENNSAAIHVHPGGRWLYVSNRGDFDSIALFAIDSRTGLLTLRGHQREGIVWPRSFALHSDGRWLLVSNQRAGEVRVFAVDPGTGALTPTGERAAVPDPTHVLLAPRSTGGAP